MKRFKVNKGLFLILPLIISLIIVLYVVVLYKKSYTWINILNIVVDVIILLFYLTKFCYEVSMDNEGVNFYTLFKKHRFKKDSIQEIRQASFLTKFEMDKRILYVLTTFKGRYILYNMFKDYK